MTDDIITRLRECKYANGIRSPRPLYPKSVCDEAADEIERLRENIEYLKNVIETLRNEARND